MSWLSGRHCVPRRQVPGEVIEELRGELKRAGIPFVTPEPVVKCAQRINSGRAYLAAARYLRMLADASTWSGAIAPLDYKASKMGQLYNQTRVEGR